MSAIKKLSPEEFPAALREIADPPETLYLEGELPGEDFIYLTVVGSRKFSEYGRQAVEKIIGDISGYPITVVSGLAIGIDTVAHRTALVAGLKTVAVPGSGLDRTVLHPHSNRRLADEIIARGGALLSELEPLCPAGVHTFPRRNRIMAGISRAVLVIEAGNRSGTLITTRLALEYGRDVFAIPGSIFSPASSGTNRLIREGAAVITSAGDLLAELGFERPENEGVKIDPAELSATERRVYEILSVENLARDELVVKLGLPISETNSLLAAMEIRGWIKEAGGEIRLYETFNR